MLVSLSPARDAAIAFAGAFLTAMLFISSTVGPLQLV